MNKKILLTGGGTAGHVNPHFALFSYFEKEGYKIYYIGSKKGIEREIIASKPGISYYPIESGKLRRYFDLKNFSDIFRIITGIFQAIWRIYKIKPDLCFSKGGFVSVPVVIGAWFNKVPIVLHESDLSLGLANRISLIFAKKIATTFPECAQSIGKKAVYTGTPLRESLLIGQKDKGLELSGFSGNKPILLVMGGSSGAQRINEVLYTALPKLLLNFDIYHLCGKGNLRKDFETTPGYKQAEFLTDELPHIYAMTDIALSRSGSNAIAELHSLNIPMLLIPYPKLQTSRGDQILNAQNYESKGLALTLQQENLTTESLIESIEKLYQNKSLIKANMVKSPAKNGAYEIYNLIKQTINS